MPYDTPVSLEDMLEAREQRVSRQQSLLKSTKAFVISMTLNMPGPVKRTRLSCFFFHRELKKLIATLEGLGACVTSERYSAHTGDEALLAVTGLSAIELKSLCIHLEEESPFSRLLDLDVIDRDGRPIGRSALNVPGRRCLICEAPAVVCASQAVHELGTLESKTRSLLLAYANKTLGDDLTSLAVEASSFELMIHPKPGLVTAYDQGSHDDMDRFSFILSQSSFCSYYKRCFEIGWERQLDVSDKAMSLRHAGLLAEAGMEQLTGGVNTHRGWIYLSGILFAASGEWLAKILLDNEQKKDREESLLWMSRMAAVIAQALENSLQTVSYCSLLDRRLNSSLPIKGIRDEAIKGFPALFETGCQVLNAATEQGDDLNLAGQRALLAILCVIEDTTLLKRAGEKHSAEVMLTLKEKLKPEGMGAVTMSKEELRQLMDELVSLFKQQGWSTGGAADLLAGSRYVERLLSELVTDL